MKVSELPAKLRELADRIEAAALPQDEGQCYARVAVHRIATRSGLAAWAHLMESPNIHASNSTGDSWMDGGGTITVFFKPGLLGGRVEQVYVDDNAGLETLLAEFPPTGTAESPTTEPATA